MGYESLHITELLSVQCLQVDDVIPILSPAVYCGLKYVWFSKIHLVASLLDRCIKSIYLWFSARQKYRDYIINL